MQMANLYFGYLAPGKKGDAFAKNCLAKHAKAQSIVHILHISRRIPN